MSTNAEGAEFVELAMALYEFLERLRGEQEEAAALVRLTPAQATVLTSLTAPMSMRSLAQRMHCDPSNITGIVDRLEGKGLVERSVDPKDRRITRVAPTRSGHETLARFHDELARLSSLTTLSPQVRQSLLTAVRDAQTPPTQDR
ncbi:MAG: MarR family winged helix-turn-helix transcriptional regulator [Pseudonocardiaceae bacterium]